jgi:serine/threonine-protein kinase
MMAGPARSLSPGSVVLGRYTIQKVIGRGGMATVYLARNQETERLVALKILDPEISSDPSYVERFRREARAAGRIRSDHVVAIYDLGTDESGTLVLVMEYLEGQTVQQALRNGRLPIPRIGHLGRHLCEGLAAAHECGVIHRDLKPANLFIERMPAGAEKLKVLDFGISKLAEASSQELTRAGQTLGTLAYMAPEQIRGTVKGNDPRIDLYAAGVSLFLMLTAKRPIDADDTVQLLQAVLEKPPLTLQQACGVEFPPALEAFVAKALQKDSARRFQNAIEMRDALLSAVSAPASAASSNVEEVMEVNSTIMCEAPRFDSPLPTATPSGVIARNGHDQAPSPVMLPSFDDDEEEGKTVVRAPHSSSNEAPSVLPAAGRRLGAPPDHSLPAQASGTPMRAATIAPTGLPTPNAGPMYAQPPGESTMIADPPSANPFGAFAGPGMQPPQPAMGPPPATNPFGPLAGGSPFAPPPFTAAPAAPGPTAAPRRSPLVFVLGAAALVAVVLVGLAGKVAMDGRNNPPTTARIEPATSPAPTPAAVPEAAPPVAQPIAAPAPVAAVAPTIPPTPIAEPAPAPVAPAPAAPVAAAEPTPAPVAAAAEPTAPVPPAAAEPATIRTATRPHRDRAPTAPRATANAATTRPARTTPVATTAPTTRPARPGRRGGRGVITDLPF